MDQFMPLFVTAALLLAPLVPASVLYFLLTPKRDKHSGEGNSASGEAEAGKFKFRFNVVGSTATYVILLIGATWIYRDGETRRLREEAQRSDALRDRQAWLVEVPVLLRSSEGAVIEAKGGEMQQVRVDLEPTLTLASSSTVQFWVVPNNGSFPTARFTLSPLSIKPENLNLNDTSRIKRDYVERRMTGIAPLWLEIGKGYGNEPK